MNEDDLYFKELDKKEAIDNLLQRGFTKEQIKQFEQDVLSGQSVESIVKHLGLYSYANTGDWDEQYISDYWYEVESVIKDLQ